MNLQKIILIIDEIYYELKQSISNVSLSKYSDSIYSLLDIYDSIHELESELSKSTFD